MTRIQHRRGTAAEWVAANPVLTAGEPAYVTDTGREKIGDGTTAWATLKYVTDASVPQGSLAVDIADPVYGLPAPGSSANAALAAAYAATPTGGTLDLGDRDITLTAQLTVSKKITIKRGRLTNALTRCLIVSAAGVVLDGVSAARTGGAGTDNGSAITLNAVDVIMKDCIASSTVGDGLTITSGTCNGARIIRGSYSTSYTNEAFSIQALSSAVMNRDIHIIGAKIRNTGNGSGIGLYNASDCLVQECDIRGMRRSPWFTPVSWTLVSGTVYRALDRTDTASNVVWIGGVTGTEFSRDPVNESLPTLGNFGVPGDGYLYINTGGVPGAVQTTRTNGYGLLFYATSSCSEGMANNVSALNHIEDTDGFGLYFQTLMLNPKGNRSLNDTLINTCLLGVTVSALPFAALGVFGGRDTVIQGTVIRGVGTATTSPAPGVRLTASPDTVEPSARLIGVRVEAATAAGFSFNSGEWTAIGCVARDCLGSGFAHGTAVSGATWQIDLIGCSAYDNALNGVGLGATGSGMICRVNIDGGKWMRNTQRGIILSAVRDSKIVNVLSGGSGINNITIGGASARVMVDNISLTAGLGLIINSDTTDLILGKVTWDASSGTKLTVSPTYYRIAGTMALATWTGTGTPEGNVTAPPGSTYRRTDGGAGTTLYVKESGTGTTGWATTAGTGGSSGQQWDALSTLGTNPLVAAASATAQTVGTAGLGFAIRVKPSRNITVAFLDWYPGSVSAGSYDIGIYSADGTTKLWSKGSTAWPTASAVSTETVPAVALVANTEYRIILAGSDATANFRGLSFLAGQAKLLDGTSLGANVSSAVPLGTTINVGGSVVTKIPLITVREA